MKKGSKSGFTIIELIVTIAMMAVLMAVLAPQLIRYIESSRVQKDESALDEVYNATYVALSVDEVYADTYTNHARVIISDGQKVTSTASALEGEIQKLVPWPITFESKLYKQRGGETIDIEFVIPYERYEMTTSWVSASD